MEGEPADREVEPPPLTRYALRHRAAEYFKETRKPREAWKTLEDLAPQLAEFDLRLIGEDYDAAASVLIEIADDYLTLWGHYRLFVERYERLQGKLTDPDLEWQSMIKLGAVIYGSANLRKAFATTKMLWPSRASRIAKGTRRALSSSRILLRRYGRSGQGNRSVPAGTRQFQDLHSKSNEAIVRGNLASCFLDVGRTTEAIEQYEKAFTLHKDSGNHEAECRDTFNLATRITARRERQSKILAEDARRLAREAGYRLIECAATGLLGDLMVREGRFKDAIRAYDEASAIADDSNVVQMQMEVRKGLALACLLAGNLPAPKRSRMRRQSTDTQGGTHQLSRWAVLSHSVKGTRRRARRLTGL